MKTKLLLLISAFFMMATIMAQPGQLDLTYNPTGVGAYGGTPPPAAYQPNAECIVYKSRIYTSGPNLNKIIIVGRFTSYNGVARKYIARLNADGTLDASFNSPAFTTGFLYTTEILPDGKILVAGDFTVGGYSSFARLNSDGSVDTTFNPTASTLKGANNWVLAINVQTDGRILIGGQFTQYNALTGKRLIRLLADGTPDPTFTGTGTVNDAVRTICMQDDKILVGGFFTGYTGYAGKNKIVRLNSDGSYDTTFNASGNGATGGTAVFDIKYVDGKIFVGGKFDNFNGVNKRAIARLNADGSLDTAFNVGNIGVTNAESNAGSGAGYNIFSLCVQPDGKILIGGNFTQYNGENIPKGIARIYQDGTRDLSFVTGTGFTGGTLVYEGKSVVRDMVLQIDGKIVVGGDFTQYNGINRRMSARIITRDCDSSVQYQDGTGWANGELPTNNTQLALIYSGTYTIPSGTHLVCCDLQINSGAMLVVASNASITVNGNIVNSGNFIVEDKGSLVQTNNTATYTDFGGGVFLAKRNTTPVKRYDYTYWSSPVQNISLYTVSPNTLADKYYKFNAPTSAWQVIMNGAETMQAAKGYIIRAPQTHSITTPSVFTALFNGRPNNGVISAAINAYGTNKWNLIGNPYPSGIDINAFLNDPANTSIGGTIYLWTHNTPLTYNGQYYLYTSNDYATYNQLGYVTPGGFSPSTFDGKVASGQGFFVEALNTNQFVYFRDAMRVSGNNSNSQFFRTSANASAESTETAMPAAAETSRYWLNMTNDQGAFNQMLVGYIDGATTGVDRNFDGRALSGNYVSLYSLIDTDKFTIQGRPTPFKANDKVSLGYKTTIAGSFQISIAQKDGLFLGDQYIFLRDKTTNYIHNLTESAYTFTSGIGEFNDRFEIVYQKKTASIVIPVGLNPGSMLTAAVNGNTISLLSARSMQQVEVYDINGKKLFASNNIQALETQITSLDKRNSVLMLYVTMDNGEQVTQKVLF
ncbi:delta-60 repeat domain-containing protein [Flavobacterium silvaticum]|uniref:Delta-60 repeat domain-containing protein n=1 Tax=Flavobacterium silvaticum TaxID=1852020 RepID=A0A972FZQ9_9FLAO|nr:delta-60 repeat domain-containing protein [Flavobacterium silvaticum]NMH27771.1 delta-60 repeat domain-containing protein [Flavobacterium silvaticum]